MSIVNFDLSLYIFSTIDIDKSEIIALVSQITKTLLINVPKYVGQYLDNVRCVSFMIVYYVIRLF